MNISFIHRGGEGMASYRYRSQIPAAQLAGEHTTSINSGEADVVVFSKPMDGDVELAERCKHNGTHVIVDFCDNHFKHPTQGEIYRKMVALSDTVICNSKDMQNVIYLETGKEAHPIPDPFEQARVAPHADGDAVLWYGHQCNLPEITPWIGKIEDLRVCTGENTILTGYTPWSLESQTAELLDANIVFLPSNTPCKTPNRLINAIMSGCFVVAKNHIEFREYAWIGVLHTGLRWVRAFRQDLNDRVLAGQDYIEKTYSPEVIGKQWSSMIGGL